MENLNQDYLQHWGVQGMKWGVRRYQNKDGTLTAAGKKRYNKELERVKAEEAKNKAKQKVLDTKKKTQAQLNDLEARKKAVELHKKNMEAEEKALRKSRKKVEPKQKRKKEETIEEKRERLLKSVDANELYKNRHLLTNEEISDRINRIDWEEKLRQRIPVEQKVDKNAKFNDAVRKLTTTYKNIDDVYSAVTKSSIGKSISEALGIGKKPEPKHDYDVDKFLADINKKSPNEIKEFKDTLTNIKNIKDESPSRVKPTKNVDLEDIAKNYKDKSIDDIAEGAKAAKALQDIQKYLDGIPIPDEEEKKK